MEYRELKEAASPFAAQHGWYLAAADLLQQHGHAAAVVDHCREQLQEAFKYRQQVRSAAAAAVRLCRPHVRHMCGARRGPRRGTTSRSLPADPLPFPDSC